MENIEFALSQDKRTTLIHVGDYMCEFPTQSLSEISPVFRAMLAPAGDGTNDITLKDFSIQYFPTLRSYIEKKEFPDPDSVELDEIKALLKLSDEYQIQGLFLLCCDTLCEKLDADNWKTVEAITDEYGTTASLNWAIEAYKSGFEESEDEFDYEYEQVELLEYSEAEDEEDYRDDDADEDGSEVFGIE